MTSDSLTRPIIGIENRTAQEAFDIMCDRFRAAEALSTSYRKALEEIVNASPALVVKAIRVPEDVVGLEAWTAAMLIARQALSHETAGRASLSKGNEINE